MAANYLALNGVGTDNTNGTSISFTTTRDILSGEHVCVAASCAVGGGDFVSCSVGSLSLSLDKFSDVQTRIFLASARATGTISSGSTVTFTYAFAANISLGICFSLSNIDSNSYVLSSASNSYSSSSSPSSGTTSSVSSGISIACVAHREGPTSITPNTYTEISEQSIISGADKQGISASYKEINNVAATQSETWTLNSSSYGDALIVVYKTSRPFIDATCRM